MTDRKSSERLVALAQKAMVFPGNLTEAEIRSLAGSVLSQARPGPVGRIINALRGRKEQT